MSRLSGARAGVRHTGLAMVSVVAMESGIPTTFTVPGPGDTSAPTLTARSFAGSGAGASRCGVVRSGAKAWGEVVQRQLGEAVVLDLCDQRAGPGDEPSHVHAVWRSAGVLFHTVGGPPQ